jgi:hypothetical protein
VTHIYSSNISFSPEDGFLLGIKTMVLLYKEDGLGKDFSIVYKLKEISLPIVILPSF